MYFLINCSISYDFINQINIFPIFPIFYQIHTLQIKKMIGTSSFDWYTFSKLNEQKPNIDQFAKLIKNNSLGQQLSNIPDSLRCKLLIVFQNSSILIKQQYDHSLIDIEKLQSDKLSLATKINTMKHQLQISISKLSLDKQALTQKKNTLEKLKQKLKKKQQTHQPPSPLLCHKKSNNKEMYYCPFCTKQDYHSRDQFTFHMFKQHARHIGFAQQNQSECQVNSVSLETKSLILSLKDKQIQLMQMMLNKKKQIDEMQLQYAYANGLKKLKTHSNFLQRKSDYLMNHNKPTTQPQLEPNQQLQGQSKYLFYQQQNKKPQYQFNQNQQNQINDQFYQDKSTIPIHNKLNNYLQIQKKKNQLNYYYLNSSFQISKSDQQISPQQVNQEKKLQLEEKQIKSHTSISNQQIKNKKYLIGNQQQHQNTNHQQQQPQILQIQSKLFNFTQNLHQKKKQQTPNIDKKYQTFNKSSKQILSQININDTHIFNSGPLMDDPGSNSDYEDYFKSNNKKIVNQQDDLVADQQITIKNNKLNLNFKSLQLSNPKPKLITTTTTANNKIPTDTPSDKIHQNISLNSHYTSNQSHILQYSKDKSIPDLQHSKQKSSDLISLSNSFSKRQILQLSKNNDETINLSDLKLSKLQRQKEKLLLLPQKQSNNNPKQKQQKFSPNIYILNEFKRDPDLQQKKQKYFIKRTEKSQSKISASLQKQSNSNMYKTKTGLLDQFFIQVGPSG